jgi:hypothetical protein
MPNPQSGEFTVAGFSLYDAQWHQGAAKLAWKPANPEGRSTLVVRAQPLDTSAEPTVYRATDLAGSIADHTAFYPSSARLPKAGTWLLTATAGSNWGCFLYSLR